MQLGRKNGYFGGSKNAFLQGYQMIYGSTDYEFPNIGRINKRFSNSFFKAFVKEKSDVLRKTKDEKQLKK